MIIISNLLYSYFSELDLDVHFHDFHSKLDLETWQPKIVILTPALQDLESLPSLKDGDFLRILFIDKKTDIFLGKSIDCIITVGQEAALDQDPSKELHQDNFNLSEIKDFLSDFMNSRTHHLMRDAVYIIGASYRLGVTSFVTLLEHQYSTDKFDLFIINYDYAKYLVCGVPLKFLETCHQLAKTLNLKLVNGRPRSSRTNEHFPLSYSEDSIFTLETVDCSKIPQDPKQLSMALKKEISTLKRKIEKL